MDEYPLSADALRGLQQRWRCAELHLREAQPLLRVDDGDLKWFREFIDNNEQGLALDELTYLGANQQVPPEFWSLLAKVVQELGITETDEIHGETVRTVKRHSRE